MKLGSFSSSPPSSNMSSSSSLSSYSSLSSSRSTLPSSPVSSIGAGPTCGVMNDSPVLWYTDDTSPISSSSSCSVSSSIVSSSCGSISGFSLSTTRFASFASADSRRQYMYPRSRTSAFVDSSVDIVSTFVTSA